MTWKKHFEKTTFSLGHTRAALAGFCVLGAYLRAAFRGVASFSDSSVASLLGVPVVVSDNMSIDEWERYRERGEE